MNAALGNVLGIFVSPALVSAFQTPLLAATPEDESAAQAGGQVDFAQVLKQLGATVLAPLIVGQIIQWFFNEPVAKFKVKCRLSDVSSFMLLTMVWSVFSDAVYSGSFSAVSAKDIVAVAIMNAGFYIIFSLLCLVLARLPLPKFIPTPALVKKLRYSREDTVAIMVSLALLKKHMEFNTKAMLFVVLWRHKDCCNGCTTHQCAVPERRSRYHWCLVYTALIVPC